MKSLLLAATVDPWISNSFPIIRIVLMVIVGLSALILIAVILMQQNNAESGTNVITGAKSESYFSQHMGSSKDVKLKRTTIALAITITVCVLLYFTTIIIYSGA